MATHEAQSMACACFTIGCRALEHGNTTHAGRWWDKARQAEDQVPPGLEVMLAHRCLGMYARGRLPEAVAAAEESVALARLRSCPKAEATALVNLAFMQLWAGEFTLALRVLNEAEDAFGEISDPFDGYESPLCFAARGVLHALRGDPSRAEEDLTRGVTTAQQFQAGWYEAIARALRAEFTASTDSRRARADARWAIEELDRRGDHWWSAWAAQAAGIAAAESGMLTAAQAILQQVLAQPQIPLLESARSLLLLGELYLRMGRGGEAVQVLQQAVKTFTKAGARYWQVRCYVRLAAAEPSAAKRWIMQARRLRDLDPNPEPAYQILFAADAPRLIAFGPGHIYRAGRLVKARTRNCECAIFLLALAGADGLHTEVLADHLWPDQALEREQLLHRVRTLIWQMGKLLGTHAWRLQRRSEIVIFDIAGLTFDLLDARKAAEQALCAGDQAQAQAAARQLCQPLLTRWQYEQWVIDEQEANEILARKLTRFG